MFHRKFNIKKRLLRNCLKQTTNDLATQNSCQTTYDRPTNSSGIHWKKYSHYLHHDICKTTVCTQFIRSFCCNKNNNEKQAKRHLRNNATRNVIQTVTRKDNSLL